MRARLKRLRRLCIRVLLVALLIPILWALAYRWVNPPTTYLIMTESFRLGGVERAWRDLADISPHMPRAAIGGEDANFCAHWGFDFDAIRAAMADKDSRRGASTLSQQVAKNVFLWPDASWLRKGLEAGFTVLIEVFWPKQRIIEVYLNVAEMGEGVFGVEAAAQQYFNRPARDLTLDQAARIAAILPNPKARNPARLAPHHRRRARIIADGAETVRRDGRSACTRPLPLPAQTGS